MTTSSRPSLPRIAALVVLLLLAAACGQKSDVANVAAGTGSGGGDAFGSSYSFDTPAADGGGAFDAPASGGFDDVATPSADPSTDTGGGAAPSTPAGGGGTTATTAASAGGGAATPAPGGGGGGGASPATTAAPAGGAAATPAGDRTGITDKEIVIGLHAPVTGAAPIPQTSFEEAKDLYWQFINAKGGLFGRQVRVVFEDDQFDPRTAIAVCKKMVTEDKAFLLLGGGGSDQITQCANYANSVGVPYLSAGVNEDGLVGVRAYFAISQSYAQQSTKLVQMTQKMFPGTKFGIAVAENASNNDAYASIQTAAKAAGLDIVYNERVPKSVNQNQALGIAAQMSQSGAEVMYVLVSPTSFLNIAAAGAGQGYTPQWIGPGLTSGLNTVASIGCQAANSVDKAIFFSPFPQLDAIDGFDPDFRASYGKFIGGDPDDLAIALWGINKTVHQMMLKAGQNVTRQSFVQTLEAGATYETNVFSALQYSAQNHLGANSVHVVRADCSTRTFKTIGTFVTGF